MTMFADYGRNRRQLERLESYSAIVTLSSHMQAEYAKHLQAGPQVVMIPPFTSRGVSNSVTEFGERGPSVAALGRQPATSAGREIRLGYIGRLESQKGVALLIDALPLVAARMSCSVALSIAGSGGLSDPLAAQAQRVSSLSPAVHIEFTGWLAEASHDDFFAALDLLVIPSVWPEPFGLVGLEAAACGVPAAAFAVGGIPDWLKDGLNGHLAKGARPCAESLAAAIVEAVEDPQHHSELRDGALVISQQFSAKLHYERIDAVLRAVQQASSSPHAGSINPGGVDAASV